MTRSAARARRFTMEGDPMTLIRIAEAHGFTITHKRWWQRTYPIPRWMVWLALPPLAIHAFRGLELIAGWLGG